MDKQLRQAITSNLKKFRLLYGYTQQTLAEHLEIDTQYYAQIERGERNLTLDKLVQICKVFNIGIEKIVQINKNEDTGNAEIIQRINNKLSSYTDNQLLIIEKVIGDIEIIF